LLDRLTHHVHILEMNCDSYRLKHSKAPKVNHRAHTSAMIEAAHLSDVAATGR